MRNKPVTYSLKYRQRIYRRPVFKRRHIQVLGDTFPPDNSFLFEDIVMTDKHKVEDLQVTIKRTVKPYKDRGK